MTCKRGTTVLGLAVCVTLGSLTAVAIEREGLTTERGWSMASWVILAFDFLMIAVNESIDRRRRLDDPSGTGLIELRLTGR